VNAAIAALTGIVAGVLHVVSGPDHLAAVLPFAVSKPRRSLQVGLFWGVGHGLGVVVLGALFFAVGRAAWVHEVSHGAEVLVGLLLVGLGIWALRRSRKVVIHTHAHAHEGSDHAHPHVHLGDPTVSDARHAEIGRHDRHHHSTLGFGFVHGVAGVGHLLAAGPILALSGPSALAYLISYLLGGVAAMMVFALVAGSMVRKPQWIPAGLAASGVASMAIGLVWIGNSFV
jgi:hypothetical protein